MSKSPTNSGAVEDAWENKHDVVGPVFLINGHFVLLDHQHVQMVGPIHRMVQIKEAMLMAARRRGEGWALDVFVVLRSSGIARGGMRKCRHKDSLSRLTSSVERHSCL